ncbi:unnamed protein product, partial [Cylindrotheca closterium]
KMESSSANETKLLLQQSKLDLKEAANQKAELENKLSASEDAIEELKDMVDRLEEDLAAASEARSAALEETSALKADLEKAQEEKEVTKQMLEEAKMESSSANETKLLLQQSKLDLKEAANQKAELENKLSASEDAIEELKDMVDRLEEDLAAASEARSAALEETSALKADLENAQEVKESKSEVFGLLESALRDSDLIEKTLPSLNIAADDFDDSSEEFTSTDGDEASTPHPENSSEMQHVLYDPSRDFRQKIARLEKALEDSLAAQMDLEDQYDLLEGEKLFIEEKNYCLKVAVDKLKNKLEEETVAKEAAMEEQALLQRHQDLAVFPMEGSANKQTVSYPSSEDSEKIERMEKALEDSVAAHMVLEDQFDALEEEKLSIEESNDELKDAVESLKNLLVEETSAKEAAIKENALLQSSLESVVLEMEGSANQQPVSEPSSEVLQKIERMEKALEDSVAAHMDLEDQFDALEDEKSSIEESNIKLKVAIDDLMNHLVVETAAKEAAMKEQSQLHSHLESSLEGAETMKQELEQMTTDMEEELQEVQSELRRSKASGAALEEQLLAAEKELQVTQTMLKDTETKTVQLQQQFISLAEQNASTEGKNSKLKEILDDLEKQVVEESEARKLAKEETIKVQTQLQNANRALDEAIDEKRTIERHAEINWDKMQTKTQEAQSALGSAKALKEQYTALEQEKAKIDTNNATLTCLVDELRQQLAQEDSATKRMLNEISELKASLEAALGETQAIKQQLEGPIDVQAQLQEDVTESMQQMEEEQTEIELVGRNDEAHTSDQAEIDRLKNDLDAAHGLIAEQSSQIEGYSKIEDQTTNVVELKEQLTLLSDAKDTALSEIAALKDSLENAEVKESNLLDELSELKRKVGQLTFDLQEKEASLRVKGNQVHSQLSANDGQLESTSLSAMFASLQSERESAVEAKRLMKQNMVHADERVHAANQQTALVKNELGQLQLRILDIEAKRKDSTTVLEKSEAFATACLQKQAMLEKEIGNLQNRHAFKLHLLSHDLEQVQSELENERGENSKFAEKIGNPASDMKAKIELLQLQLKMKESTLKRREDEISDLQSLLKENMSTSEWSLVAVEALDSSSRMTLGKGASSVGKIYRSKYYSMPSPVRSGDLNAKIELVQSQLKIKESTLKKKQDEINCLQDLLKEKESIIKNYPGDAAQDHGHKVEELERELKESQSKIETIAGSKLELEKAVASLKQHAIDGDSAPVKRDRSGQDHGVFSFGFLEKSKMEINQPHQNTTTTTSDTSGTNPRFSQQHLAHDLFDEIGMLRMQLSDMMEQTESLASDLDEKDIALKHTNMQMQRLQDDNKRLRMAVEAIGDMTPGETMESHSTEVPAISMSKKLHSAQQKIAANKLLITSLQEEIDLEKHRCKELEVLVSEKDSDSSACVLESHSSSTGEKSESIIIEDFQGWQLAQSKPRHFDPLDKGEAKTTIGNEKLVSPEIHLDGKIVELRHSTCKKDEIIEMLRSKQREQEALISLLNKALNEKDAKITRLERLLAEKHSNVHIVKELEENELTIDSLVLIRSEKDTEIKKLKGKLDHLENKLKDFDETKYQLRHRTEEIAEKETKIHQLKAELEDESKRVKDILDDRQEQLERVREEKMHLRLDLQDHSRKFKIKLKEKEELIKSIHSEATEQGLLIDSLDTSLMEANKRLQQLESDYKQQTAESTSLAMKLEQVAQEKATLIEDHKEKDVLIRMLNEARLDGEKVIEELTKPKQETNRQKILRRYKQMQAEEGVSSLDTYMEPFVLDLQQAQTEYQLARKNLRLAKARERLIRPRV